MRKQFVQCETEAEAREACPWASVIVEAEGGYWCFEDVREAEPWQRQV